jgi:hypothetical protein
MEVIEVLSKEYDDLFTKTNVKFNSGIFSSINKNNCENIFYLIFKDSKIRLGIILGVRDNILLSPFSAPFGGFENLNKEIKLNQIDDALNCLNSWAISNKFIGIKITLPPIFYNTNFLSKVSNCLYRSGYENVSLDINYQFNTEKLDDNYIDSIWHNARRNLKTGIKSELSFEKLDNNDGEKAYNIIAKNREQRGFPLRMKWAQIQQTISIISADFFIVKKETTIIASAIVFHVSKDVVQIIYWGDLPDYSKLKTMNFLAYEIFKFYKETGVKVVDIGPSTEDSLPNFGLCEFKESIGCDLSLKYGFYKKFEK